MVSTHPKVDAQSAAQPATPAPTAHGKVAEQIREGKARRGATPRSAQGQWAPAKSRADPINVLQASDAQRLPELNPIRYGRMLASPFAFLRGAAEIMAADLAPTPNSDISVQLSGDAHLMNFGAYVTPESNVVFGLNDFDQTLPGPWEWDVKRLVASIAVAGRSNHFTDANCAAAAAAAVRSYQLRMGRYARKSYLDVWYARLDEQTVIQLLPNRVRSVTEEQVEQARRQNQLGQLSKLTTQVNGSPKFADAPPLLTHVSDERMGDHVEILLARYAATLANDRQSLLLRYTLQDYALKVVGVGSVGMRCYVMLLTGRDEQDPLFLQIKEAIPSALEPYLGRSVYKQPGERVVQGQRMLQAATDIFLGWGRVNAVDFYIRRLPDVKGTVNLAASAPAQLAIYAQICGWALARAHARSGAAALISGYIGRSEQFVTAMSRFALLYADQTERDHAALAEAVKAGRIKAEVGV